MLIAFHRDAVSTVATGPDGKAVAAPAPTRRSIQLDDGESEETGEEDGAEADEMAELLDVVAWQWAAPYRKSGPSTKSNQTRIIKTPGGRLVYQYTKKRASGPKCPVTGKKIQGNIGSYLINRGG